MMPYSLAACSHGRRLLLAVLASIAAPGLAVPQRSVAPASASGLLRREVGAAGWSTAVAEAADEVAAEGERWPVNAAMLTSEKEEQVHEGILDISGTIDCGGHRQTACADCPTRGGYDQDRGALYCNGDCYYSNGTCLWKGITSPSPITLFHRPLTAEDNETIRKAAAAAVRAANLEAQQDAEEEMRRNRDHDRLQFIVTLSITIGVMAVVCLSCTSICCCLGIDFFIEPGPRKEAVAEEERRSSTASATSQPSTHNEMLEQAEEKSSASASAPQARKSSSAEPPVHDEEASEALANW